MKERLKAELITLSENLYLWRNVLAIIGILSLMLPWVKLDGASGSITGSGLIAYLLTGTERLDMLRNSFLGTATLLLVPISVLVTTIMVWIKAFTEKSAFKMNIITILLPLPLLIFAGSVTSSQNILAKGIMTPQVGVIILVLSQAAMIALEAFMLSGKPLPWNRGNAQDPEQDERNAVSQKSRRNPVNDDENNRRTTSGPAPSPGSPSGSSSKSPSGSISRPDPEPESRPAREPREQIIGEMYSSEPTRPEPTKPEPTRPDPEPEPRPARRPSEQIIGEMYSSEPTKPEPTRPDPEPEPKEREKPSGHNQGETTENGRHRRAKYPGSDRESRKRGHRTSRLVQIYRPQDGA